MAKTVIWKNVTWRTLSTDDIRYAYARALAVDRQDVNKREIQFKLWLQEHDRQVKAEAWADGWQEADTFHELCERDPTAARQHAYDKNPYDKEKQ